MTPNNQPTPTCAPCTDNPTLVPSTPDGEHLVLPLTVPRTAPDRRGHCECAGPPCVGAEQFKELVAFAPALTAELAASVQIFNDGLRRMWGTQEVRRKLSHHWHRHRQREIQGAVLCAVSAIFVPVLIGIPLLVVGSEMHERNRSKHVGFSGPLLGCWLRDGTVLSDMNHRLKPFNIMVDIPKSNMEEDFNILRQNFTIRFTKLVPAVITRFDLNSTPEFDHCISNVEITVAVPDSCGLTPVSDHTLAIDAVRTSLCLQPAAPSEIDINDVMSSDVDGEY